MKSREIPAFLFGRVAEDACQFVADRLQSAEANRAQKGMPPASFARHFRTAHVNLGRGVGKSTWIAERITKRELLLVPNETCKRMFSEHLRRLGREPILILTGHDVDLCRWYDPNLYVNVFVDDPSLTFPRAGSLDRMYMQLATRVEGLFVLLGE